MAQKIRNPLAQALGLVLQATRDKMGGISSSQIASALGLAASHYRMVEAGSAILQPARAIKIIQTFETIEFIPLCQVLVAIQILDSAKQSANDMKTIAGLLIEANPSMAKVLKSFDQIWDFIETAEVADVARKITALDIDRELEIFLTTEPVTMTHQEIDNFMTPTFQYPISGQLYDKIGNILQGVAPFYLDTILLLIDNLKNITPRVTPDELAKWESQHKNRISNIIGILRDPEIILNVDTFDYTFLWEDNFRTMLILYRQQPSGHNDIHTQIVRCLRQKYEEEHVRYERQLQDFDDVVQDKLIIKSADKFTGRIDKLLLHRNLQMNNLWTYIMTNGYVVPFIDNASVNGNAEDLYGTSLAYDETCEKLVIIRELCDDVRFKL